MMKKTITLAFICLSLGLMAQQMGACGTYMSPEQMQEFYNRDVSHLNKNSRAVVEIGVVYHIINRTDGSGGFAMNDLLALHCKTNEDFAPADVRFIIVDILNIDSNYFYDWNDGNAGNNLMDSFNIDNVCNIYLSPNAKSGTTPVCGYSFTGGGGPNRGGVVLANGCSGPGSSTLTHEMGHYLNLPHTFSGWEGTASPDENSPAPSTIGGGWWSSPVEKVARTNCNQAGDGFCGTQPDYISDRWNCNVNGESQEFLDPDGVAFRIDGSNYMSYADDACHDHFSPDQQAEVNAAPANYRPYLLNYNLEDYQPVTEDVSIVFPQDNAQNVPNDNLELRWESVEHADYYYVELGFTSFFNPLLDTVITDTSLILNDLLDDRDYVWRVKPFNYQYTCKDYTPTMNFKTSSFAGSVVIFAPSCPGEFGATGSAEFSNPLGGDTYSWSSPDPLLNAQVASFNTFNITNVGVGQYSLEVNRGGDLLVIDFFIEAPGEIEIGFVNNGTSLEAIVSGGTPPYTTIAWSNGVTGNVNNTPVAGTNTLTVIDDNGCIRSASTTYTVAITEEEKALNTTIVYPNPLTNELLNIEISMANSENATFEIYNVAGQLILAQNEHLHSGNNLIKVDLSDTPKGIYLVKTTINQYSKTEKLVVVQ